jgi:hypothetical protein
MGIISGTTHMQKIISFSPGTGKHFPGSALCSCGNSVTHFIHILQIFIIKNVFYKPPPKINPKESNVENEGAGNESPASCPTVRMLHVQRDTNTTGDMRLCTV